jgi:hypothetical protein
MIFRGWHEDQNSNDRIYYSGVWLNGRWIEGNLIQAENFCCILEQEEPEHRYDYPYLDGDIGIIDGKAIPIMSETICPVLSYSDDKGHRIGHMDILQAKNRYGTERFLVQWFVEEQMFSTIQLTRPGVRLHGGVEGRYSSGSAEMNWRDFVYQVLQHPFDDNTELEVVGNAFSNPELLKPYLPESQTIDLRWCTSATSHTIEDLSRLYASVTTTTNSGGGYINVPRHTF